MNQPLVSVIMSVYKEPLEWVNQSIDSILNQTYSNFEFIIINDNPSDDNLKNFLDKYQVRDNRIILVKNQDNIGLTKSLNRGLKKSKGKYVARMDADDISYPNRLEKQVELMETNPEVIVCGSKIKVFGKKSYLHYNTYFENDADIRGQMILNSGFAHPTVIIRRKILIDNNILYDEDYNTAQDYKLWYDLRRFGKFANCNKKLLKYRISESQISTKKMNDQQSNRDTIRQLFTQDYISNNRTNDIQKIDMTRNPYIIRLRAHNENTFGNIFRFIFNTSTEATVKEKIIVTLLAFRRAILNDF